MPVWCQDEAGPYQAIPHPGAGWAPVGAPARLPHEYLRGGTAKLLTLPRPATGEVRAKGVTNATNAVLHPWLQRELTAVLAALPPATEPEGERPPLARWATRLGREPRESLPPLRLILIWDNLAGHLSWPSVRWRFQHGVMPLYTPISGSWLHLAEIELSTTTGQCPNRRIPDRETLEREVAEWEAERDVLRGPANWRFSTADARVKLRRLYPSLDG